MKPRAFAMLLMLCSAAAAAEGGAQAVHKCTQDGKVTYTEQPCAGGAVIAVPDAPAPDKSAAAELKRAKKQADALEKERLKRQAADSREDAAASRAAAARRQKCEKLRLDKKWADEDLRRAQPQHEERARVKAQRAADKLDLACAS